MAGDDPRRQRNALKHALPVYSVDTAEQAEALIRSACRLRYDNSFAYDRTVWTGELSQMDKVSATLAALEEVRDVNAA